MQPSIKMFFSPKQPVARVASGENVGSNDDDQRRSESPAIKRPAEDNENTLSSNKRQAISSPSSRTPIKNERRKFDDHEPLKTPRAAPSTPLSKLSLSETPKNRIPIGSPRVEQPQSSSADTIQHPHLEYKFLYPPERRDIQKRKPDDPDYDEKTLYVPEGFLNSQTPAMRQWWLIKQKNMDAILFFKMGKFYELFNEDAVIGVNNLDIMYMKGDESKPAHAGFPEVSYEKYSKMLIDKGFKVIRIEQTETPAMMEDRCQTTGKRGKFDKVVRREVCRVTTKGTQMLGVMETVFNSSKNQYLLAICESSKEVLDTSSQKVIRFGVCFIDVTISKLYIGQFDDDHNLSRLNILLAHHIPTEVIYERNNLSQESYRAIMKTGALLTTLKPDKEFWPIKRALSHLITHDIIQNDSEWLAPMRNLFMDTDSLESISTLEPKAEFKLALSSFGALVFYLQSQLIAKQVLTCISFELYNSPLERSSNDPAGITTTLQPMILDHIALRNLEVFENSSGETYSTLFESINYCKTHFGERLLRNWICAPLCDIEHINNRLDAVEALISNNNASLMNEFVHILSQTPDLERLLAKVKSQCFKSESDSRAIMFDGQQYSKAKISSFLNLLSNFKRLQKFISSMSRIVINSNSEALRRLLTFTTDGGLYPDYGATLDYFESAFDHETARRTGQIIPASGVDKTYDNCRNSIDDIKTKLDDYLEDQKKVVKCKHIEYFGTAKNRYQIQIPESYCSNLPPEYRIETTRKGVKRYYTPTIDRLFQKLTVYEEEMKKTLDGIMSKIFEQFSRKFKLWKAAIECMATLDVLQSIANFIRSLMANNVDMCRPQLIENKETPVIEYANGRHPALVKLNPNYIPNNLEIYEKLILLSGANMGGKSTLMRQTALLVILAQIGCFVPASSMRLTPVDRIFSRLGASDRLVEGESTFYTELVETSAMLRCATRNSLLLLDELGRGTSTYDGTAIAYSVLEEISQNLQCRCLFSTHYHTLVRDFQNVDRVRLAHMACKVENNSNSGEIDLDPLKENITFLFKITEGPVGRSYGFNVAKLAGIDDQIIKDAFKKSKELELRCQILETLQKFSLKENLSTGNAEHLKKQVIGLLVSKIEK